MSYSYPNVTYNGTLLISFFFSRLHVLAIVTAASPLTVHFSHDSAAKVGIGFLLQDIYNLFTAPAPRPKFSLISGHDTTLFPILTALGVFDGLWPHYAGRIVFELYSTVRATHSSRAYAHPY
jgi:hypothetical protein